MGIKPIAVPDNIWARMIETDRKKFPRKIRETNAERERRQITTLERKIHDQFSNFCRRNGITVWHSSPIRRSSIRKGLPDFLCWKGGRAIAIEFKIPPNKLTKEQEIVLGELNTNRNPVYVCEEVTPGAAYCQATALLCKYFNLTQEAQ